MSADSVATESAGFESDTTGSSAGPVGHSPTPWKLDTEAMSPRNPLGTAFVLAGGHMAIDCMHSGDSHEQDMANAERIVACVNALEGIADPSAIPEVIAALSDLREAVTNAYKSGRIPAEPFIRAGLALSKVEGR